MKTAIKKKNINEAKMVQLQVKLPFCYVRILITKVNTECEFDGDNY
jgi:hypothetical protein